LGSTLFKRKKARASFNRRDGGKNTKRLTAERGKKSEKLSEKGAETGNLRWVK